MTVFTAAVASVDSYELAEGPVWDAARQRVLWVDINAGHVYSGLLRAGRLDVVDRIAFPGTVGAAASSAAGDLIVAGQRHIHYLDSRGHRRIGPQLIPDRISSRLNDGGCDPAGRFLAGSLALDGRQCEEALVRIENDSVTVIDKDLTLSNGLAWSPDASLMYNIDTTPGIIWARSYDSNGVAGPRTEFLRFTDGGLPDGLCTDVDGNLWVAVWGAGQVRCFSPTGSRLGTVEVPAPNTSSAAFVGPNLDTLLITTARENLSADQLAEFPDSGRLFVAQVGTSGSPVAAWCGH